MNRYELLFKEIVDQTDAGLIRWKEVGRRADIEIFYRHGEVFGQFEAEFSRGAAKYQLILVERMVEDLERDFPKYVPEVLVMDQGEILATLSDAVIDRRELLQFAKTVRGLSEYHNRLFDSAV